MTIDPRNFERDSRVLDAMAALAHRHGYLKVTRGMVAQAANVCASTVSNFGRRRLTNGEHPRGEAIMPRLHDALMQRAVDHGDLVVLAQGIANRHPIALAAPEQLRAAALASAAA